MRVFSKFPERPGLQLTIAAAAAALSFSLCISVLKIKSCVPRLASNFLYDLELLTLLPTPPKR